MDEIDTFCGHCEENNHCNHRDENDVSSFPLQVLKNWEYSELITKGMDIKNGDAIHLINFLLECKESHFTSRQLQGYNWIIIIIKKKKSSQVESFNNDENVFEQNKAEL